MFMIMEEIPFWRSSHFGTKTRLTTKVSAEVGEGQRGSGSIRPVDWKAHQVTVQITKKHSNRMLGRLTVNRKPAPSLQVIGQLEMPELGMRPDWLISLSNDMRWKAQDFLGESRENGRMCKQEQAFACPLYGLGE